MSEVKKLGHDTFSKDEHRRITKKQQVLLRNTRQCQLDLASSHSLSRDAICPNSLASLDLDAPRNFLLAGTKKFRSHGECKSNNKEAKRQFPLSLEKSSFYLPARTGGSDFLHSSFFFDLFLLLFSFLLPAPSVRLKLEMIFFVGR